MKRLYISLLCGIALMGIGLALAFYPVSSSQHTEAVVRAQTLSASAPAWSATEQQAYFGGAPVRLQIPSLNIDLPIINGYYDSANQTWTLTKDKVQFAVMTKQPNNREGLTFMYAHNRPGVFDAMHNIRAGEEAKIQTGNGHTFTYRFTSAYETDPNDDSIFGYQGAPVLVLQTCSGANYQNRQHFLFDLAGAQ